MPDAPISTTPTIGLGQWADQANPGFLALNENWQLIDDAVLALQVAMDLLEVTLQDDITTEASARAAADVTLQTNINSEATTRAAADATLTAADLTFLKLDGTRPMEADLDMDSNQVVNLGNGTLDHHAINKGQLDAAIAAGLGALGVYEYCRARASADLASGVSPRTFEADTNDEITDGDMHSTSSNKDRFVAQQDALYLFQARFQVNGWGGCTVQWYKNGTLAEETRQPESRPAVGSNVTFIHSVCLINLAASDYVTVKVFGLVEPDDGYIMANSSVTMFALSANAAGGGDFLADGSVPMTGDLNFGGNKGVNAEDGVAATDLATVGQIADLVEDEVAAELAAALPTAVADAVDDALAALPIMYERAYDYKKNGNVTTTTTPTTVLTLSPTIKGASIFWVEFSGVYNSQSIGHPRIAVGVKVDGVTVFESELIRYQVGAGDDFFQRMPVSFKIPLHMSELGLAEGAHTITIYHYSTASGKDAQLYANATAWPTMIVEYQGV